MSTRTTPVLVCLVAALLLPGCDKPTAPAPDVAPPVVQILSPVGDASLDSLSVMLSGTLSDSVGVNRATYAINQGAEQDLSITPGTTVSFSTRITLQPGPNAVTVHAYDAAGNKGVATVGGVMVDTVSAPRGFSISAPEKVVNFRAESLGISGGYHLDISESGIVVGMRYAYGAESGFLWSRSTGERDIGSLGGTSFTTALGINTKGEIVGSSSPAGASNRVAFLRSPTGTLRAIGPLDTYSFAHDINDGGVVVGSVNLEGATRAFRWSAANGLVVLPAMGGGRYSVAYAVNEDGVTVGTSNYPTGASLPVVWSPSGDFRWLPVLAQPYGVASDINKAGQAVGISQDAAGKRRAVLWEPGGEIRDLGTLGGDESHAMGINNRGEIVGGSRTAEGVLHAFYWSKQRGMIDLGKLPDGRFSSAVAINDAGQIIGVSGDRNGEWVTLWEVNRGEG